MQFDPYQALYIHIPFCKKRCNYCDFTTEALPCDDAVFEEYVDSLILAIKRASKQNLLGSIKTVYIGGGTPSYIGNKQLSRLLYALSLFMHLTPEAECTLEANPESLTEAMVKDLFALGVTRISLGVQSFDNKILSVLGRVHSAEKAKEALCLAKKRFDNISVDIMCGIPGQSDESFLTSLKTALDLGAKHLSVYPLTIEANTPFSYALESQALDFDEDRGADMMHLASQFLSEQGMYRYEVANYAYPGYESKHNSAYWSAKSYLGLGKGAVSMKQNKTTRIREQDGVIIETLDARQRISEDLMLAMRMTRGVSFDLLQRACETLPLAQGVFDQLVKDGFVKKTQDAFCPTEKGWMFGNVMYGRILDLAP